LLEAVEWLHSRSVMHRDMKLCNILMTRHGRLKLCDFGLARYVSAYDESYTPGVVTLWYRWSPHGQLPYTSVNHRLPG
jgi:serine/threonine protein kinase